MICGVLIHRQTHETCGPFIFLYQTELTPTSYIDELARSMPESKTRKNLSVDGRRITKLVKGPKGAEVVINLDGGDKKMEGFIAHKPMGKVNGPFVEQLDLETTEQGDIKVNFPFNETSKSGVFAVGDCSTMMKAVTGAISMGGAAAAGVAAQLEAED